MQSEQTNKNQRLACLALHLRGASNLKYFRTFGSSTSTDFMQTGYRLYGDQFPALLDKAKDLLQRSSTPDMVTILDREYPQRLRNCINPPLAFFYKGNIRLLKHRKVSIVGTRKPSLFSIFWVAKIAEYISRNNIVLVSGMAQGIDSVVHANSLYTGTIGVLPQSLEIERPVLNRYLYKKAAQESKVLLLSEYPPGSPARKYHFPQRNRIIAGLSPGIIFAEGGANSGALITAQWALKNKRPVYILNHELQKNNAGALLLRKNGGLENEVFENKEVKDITPFFPVRLLRSGFSLKPLQEKMTYLGNSLWVLSDSENFSLKFLLPDQQDPDFEPYNG